MKSILKKTEVAANVFADLLKVISELAAVDLVLKHFGDIYGNCYKV